jgi:hypothetical protein
MVDWMLEKKTWEALTFIATTCMTNNASKCGPPPLLLQFTTFHCGTHFNNMLAGGARQGDIVAVGAAERSSGSGDPVTEVWQVWRPRNRGLAGLTTP